MNNITEIDNIRIERKEKEILIKNKSFPTQKYSIVFKEKTFDIYQISKEQSLYDYGRQERPTGKELVRNCINYNRGYLDKYIYEGLIRSWRRDEEDKVKDNLKKIKTELLEEFKKRKYNITKELEEQEFITDILSLLKYPFVEELAKNFNYSSSELSSTFKSALKDCSDWDSFLNNLCGSNNSSLKRFIGELLEYGQLFYLTVIYSIKGLVPVEYYKLIWTENKDFYRSPKHKNFLYGYYLRLLLSNYKQERIRILLTNLNDVHILSDTLNQYKQIRENKKLILPESPRTFKELHDAISRQFRILGTPYKEFKQYPIAKKIDGKIVNDMKIVTAKNNHELIEWGETMNNCIASYDDSYDRTLLGVYRKDQLVYNIELNKHRIGQFKSKNNGNPKENDRTIIEAFIEDVSSEIRKEEEIYKKKLKEDKQKVREKGIRDKNTPLERATYTSPAPTFDRLC